MSQTSTQITMTNTSPLYTTSTNLPTPISSSSSSLNDDTSKCMTNCYLLTTIILVLLVICFILLKLSYTYLYKRRRCNSVDIENNYPIINNNNNNNNNDDNDNNNHILTEVISTSRLNDSSEMLTTTNPLINQIINPQNALVRNRHTISARSHSNNNYIQHTLLKRTRTTISYIIANNNNNNLRNDFIFSFTSRQLKNNNIEILVEKFPLPPPPPQSSNIDEIIKKFNKPWEFVPEMTAKEMNTVKVMNRGRFVEINPETWSSVVKDASVQSNYPFHVPKPPKKDDGNNISEKKIFNEIFNEDEIFDDEKDEITSNENNEISKKVTLKEKVDEKEIVEEEKHESINDKVRKKLKQRKDNLRLIHKTKKIEETIEEYKDGEGFDYFEITVLEKEDSQTNITIGVATKPFPCHKLPGHTEYSIGYHSNTGEVYQNSKYNGWEYGPPWNDAQSTVGCGYRPLTGEIYFTFNGLLLSTLYTAEVEYDVENEKRYYLFPSIGANGKCKVRVNFGEEKFIYNEKNEEFNIEGLSESSDEENAIKNSLNNPLGKWKDVRLEINEKVWWNNNTTA